MMELILSQSSLHALNKCFQLMRRNSQNVAEADHGKQLINLKQHMIIKHNMVEGGHASQNLLTQVINLTGIEEGHPSVKILSPIAKPHNQRNLRWIITLVHHK